MKKRYVFQALLLICLTACGSKDEFDATGTFEATEIVVSSEATGKLFYLNAEEGMHFTQGTEVGLIDTVQLYLKKRQLEANSCHKSTNCYSTAGTRPGGESA